MTIKTYPLLAFILFGTNLAQSFDLPKGWKTPEDSSFLGAWRKPSPTKYLTASVDINCDGLMDSFLILQPEKGLGIGLFAFLQKSDGSYKSGLLFDSRKDAAGLKGISEKEKKKLQFRYSSFFGIRIAERGIYPTACGQGYRACEKGEKRKIEIECGGIDLFPIDQGGNLNFYWDRKKKKILSAVMSD